MVWFSSTLMLLLPPSRGQGPYKRPLVAALALASSQISLDATHAVRDMPDCTRDATMRRPEPERRIDEEMV